MFDYPKFKEMASDLGIDLDTMEGDYAEAYHHMSRMWHSIQIDNPFDDDSKKIIDKKIAKIDRM